MRRTIIGRCLQRGSSSLRWGLRLAVCCVLAAVSVVASATLRAADPWISCNDDVSSEWRWEHSESGEVVTGTPTKDRSDVELQRIFVIAGKRSPSYSLALGRIARDFQDAGLAVEWRCVNFDRDKALAATLLEPLASDAPEFDLVLALGTEALGEVHLHLDGKRIPVVTSTCKNPSRLNYSPEDGSPAGGNIAYTSLNVTPDLQVRYLQKMLPKLDRLLICVNSEREQVMTAEVEPLVKECEAANISVEIVAVAGSDDVAAKLRAAAPPALATIENDARAAWWVSSCTALFDHVGVLQELRGLPVLAENPLLVRSADDEHPSAMAAIGIDRRHNAHLAARYAIRILRKETSPGMLPLGVYDPPDIRLNVRRFRHHELRVPFELLEAATMVFDDAGNVVQARSVGR